MKVGDKVKHKYWTTPSTGVITEIFGDNTACVKWDDYPYKRGLWYLNDLDPIQKFKVGDTVLLWRQHIGRIAKIEHVLGYDLYTFSGESVKSFLALEKELEPIQTQETNMVKLELGKKYVRRDGKVTGALISGVGIYPFMDPEANNSYNLNGVSWPGYISDDDLISEYVEELENPKKTLTFWEARLAALKGKKVRTVGTHTEYGASAFQEYTTWNTFDIDAEWEIVEEPKLLYIYLNTYENGHGQALNTKGQADVAADGKGRTGCIEIITENGKLISAKNV